MFDCDWAGDIQGVLSTLPYLDTGCYFITVLALLSQSAPIEAIIYVFCLEKSEASITHLGWEGGTGSLMWMTVFMLPVPFWLKSQTSCTLAPVSDIILATDNVVRLHYTIIMTVTCSLSCWWDVSFHHKNASLSFGLGLTQESKGPSPLEVIFVLQAQSKQFIMKVQAWWYCQLSHTVPEVHKAVVYRRWLGPLYGGQPPPAPPLHRGRSLRMRSGLVLVWLPGQDNVHIPGAGPQQPPRLLHSHAPNKFMD